jgi:hypothetical protein
MILRNLRRVDTPEGEAMTADFTIADGRTGSVSVLLSEFEAHGEAALEQVALACAAQHAMDGYIEPGRDRLNELS